MQYDVLHLPGPPITGCGATSVSPELGPDHERGDRIKLVCPHCGVYGELEVRAPLRGL